MQEEAVIQEILEGRTESFNGLTDKYRGYLFQVVYAIVRNPKDAEDVVQEAWMSVFLSLPHYRQKGFKTWMTRIAVNKAIDFNRKRRIVKESPMADAALESAGAPYLQEAPPEQSFILKEKQERIQKGLAGIPPNYREVLVAYYIEEKSYQEIATHLGVEVRTVESKLYRAKMWIRDRWKEEDYR